MNTAAAAASTAVDTIARTCLYEGYLLWPYRRSALKNTKRWTFGGVFPGGECADVLGEPASITTEVLLEHGGTPREVAVRLRFLQVVDRQVVREGPNGPEPVDELTVDGERHLAWQEATEREVLIAVTAPGGPRHTAIAIPKGSQTEHLTDSSGRRVGSVIRSWQRLTGALTYESQPTEHGVDRLTVRVENTTACPPPHPADRHARERAAPYAFSSTHVILHSDEGLFVSLLDPPEQLRGAAASCANRGVWPVLAGDGNGHMAHTVLASPITLYDFPRVAPESPGDLFDGTEIDQLLVLSVLSMTEEEQAEARACDPRAREILDRCAGLDPEAIAALHGTIREFRPSAAPPAVATLEDV